MDHLVGLLPYKYILLPMVQLNANLTPAGKRPARIGIFTRTCGCVYWHIRMPRVIRYG